MKAHENLFTKISDKKEASRLIEIVSRLNELDVPFRGRRGLCDKIIFRFGWGDISMIGFANFSNNKFSTDRTCTCPHFARKQSVLSAF